MAVGQTANGLALLSQAAQMLAECKTVAEVKDFRDKAAALQRLAKARGYSISAQNDIAEWRIRGERQAGEMLAQVKPTAHRPAKVSRDVILLRDVGITANQSHHWQRIAGIPVKQFETVIAETKSAGRELTTASLLTYAKAHEKQSRKTAKVKAKSYSTDDVHQVGDDDLFVADISSVNGRIADGSLDWIITDPPYPKEFLPLYGALAEFARRALKPGGGMLVMIGQSYLPEVLALMTPHIRYHWTIAYLTPGGQSVQLFDRKVNTFWKPVLWFVNGEHDAEHWVGDVASTATNDSGSRLHEWGQSEVGMADLIERFTYPDELVCDPFLGGGTTGAVAVRMGRRFVGFDRDAEAVRASKERIAAAV